LPDHYQTDLQVENFFFFGFINTIKKSPNRFSQKKWCLTSDV